MTFVATRTEMFVVDSHISSYSSIGNRQNLAESRPVVTRVLEPIEKVCFSALLPSAILEHTNHGYFHILVTQEVQWENVGKTLLSCT